MNKNITTLLLTLVVITIVLIVGGAFYVVDETQQVVVTQFGELIDQPKINSGLYFKIPFIQVANYFDKRVLEWNGDANQIPTLDKRLIWVDTTARWKIVDPLKFMQTMRNELTAQTRLDDIIDASTRDIISSHRLIEAIRSSNRLLDERNSEKFISSLEEEQKTALEPIEFGREELAKKIFRRAADTMPTYGIELIDVRIKSINYIQDDRQKVYERMISERKRAAEKFRSEGQGKKAEIEGRMAKDLEQINSEAYRKAQEIKGKADAEAIKIYADAFNKDPEFYSFLRTLESYRTTINKETTLILSTDNDYFKRLNTIGAVQ